MDVHLGSAQGWVEMRCRNIPPRFQGPSIAVDTAAFLGLGHALEFRVSNRTCCWTGAISRLQTAGWWLPVRSRDAYGPSGGL